MIVETYQAAKSASLALRRACPTDAGAITILNRVLAIDADGVNLDDQTLRAGVLAVLHNPALGRYWLACGPEKAVIGQLELKTLFDEWTNQYYGWIDNVAVARPFRQQGIAARLVERAKQHARHRGLTMLRLYVAGDNDAAERLYVREGFKPKGRLLEYRL